LLGNETSAKTAHCQAGINMIILDTNVFIYIANGTLPTDIIAKVDIAHANVTKIEALGFSTLPANELLILTSLFNESYNLALSDNIVDQAVQLRQARRMSLGDAIIAATALEYGVELWTVNTEDFKHIEGLKLANPLKSA
jgi:hypothetical protein